MIKYSKTNFVTIPLTTKRKGIEIVPTSSGLNWGQRPGRDKNQAYLPVSTEIQICGFFPKPGEKFLIKWDDDEELICVRAQQYGKAIQTPNSNAILGRYFRRRLGVQSGESIVMPHLVKYGRSDIEIYRIESNIYYGDFSVRT